MSEFSPRVIDSFRRSLAEQRAQLVSEIRAKLADAKDERVGIDETSSVAVGDRAFWEQNGLQRILHEPKSHRRLD